ncbi:energy transducer TonB family protein [Peredibacter starrii]|uniref:Energy transducer TonB n=1 Tax=Peredibacter starrii TaxID=28202 RepID=A0AAX4HJM3_9BACT|nr:energy transducer TonB [Peredibacter starrii]WPU63234.1 energy transducer TonB [Peredibacter starrii]
MGRSWWANSKRVFLALLIIFSLIHLGTMLLRLKILDRTKYTPVAKTRPPIKVDLRKLPPSSQSPFKKQIVESEDGGEKKKVKGAYLSDKDRAFDKETIAKRVDPFNKGAKAGGGEKGDADKSKKGSEGKKKNIASGKGRPNKGMKLSDLGAHVGQPDPFMEAAKEYSSKKKGNGGDPNLPGRSVSSTNDHVEEVPLGDMTHLNTVEYKYYGFYHRIKQRLEQFWGRSIQEKAQQLAKAGRTVASDDELVTSLQITMNHLGEVLEISITGASGIKELDDAAIESFNQAGPFPNPPKGLLQDGKVTIEWGFVVNT